MKILLAHNFYQSSAPSGEDIVFANEIRMLEHAGNEICTFTKHNDELKNADIKTQLSCAVDSAWSKSTYQELSSLLRRTKPQVAHFHNTFPLISPSAYAACVDNGVPVVQTLHNFRLICAGAMLFRKGRPCEKCLTGKRYQGLIHRCYRDSFLASAAATRMLTYNWKKGTYRLLVNRYIALSAFARDRFIAGGLPEHKITIKPNFLSSPPQPGSGGDYAVFVGRLSREKGLLTLLSAWESVRDNKLLIVGDGPLRSELEKIVERRSLNVDFAGFCTKAEVHRYVGGALFQVIPSECYEGFPMVLLEAYASGTPVLASRIGSLDEIVREGVTGAKFQAGDIQDLADCLQRFFREPDRIRKLRPSTRQVFNDNYTEQHNILILKEIYADAIAEAQGNIGSTSPHIIDQKPLTKTAD